MSGNKKEVPLVVVDTDPGTDDALALYMLLAAEKKNLIKILAITCVSGNADVQNGTRNALRVLQSINRLDVPVYKGANGPLIIEPLPRDEIRVSGVRHHGADGFGGATFEVEPDLNLIQKQSAVMSLIELANQHKGQVNLLCLGPLTNVALAIKSDSEFSNNLKSIFIMGGNISAFTNATLAADFNFFHDPEAAHIVLANAPNHVTLVPKETCRVHGFSYEWRVNIFGKAGSKQIELLNKIEAAKLKNSNKANWIPCDSFIPAVFIDPSIVKKVEMLHVTLELHGARTRGQSVIDHLGSYNCNVKLVGEIDVEKFKQLMYMAVDHPNLTI